MTKIRHVKPYHCVKCKYELRGDPIPKDQQKMLGVDYFGKEIGLYDMWSDCTVAYKCPNCDHVWTRITFHEYKGIK